MSARDYFSLGHPLTRFRSHFALRARGRMFELFMELLKPSSSDRVLDLGVTPDTTLPESNLFEALYPHRNNLVAASIEDASDLTRHFPGLRCVQILPGPLPFENDEFDILFCSAVLEHVGNRVQQAAFLAETLRVARRVFITTPNKGFPVDFHTFLPLLHWLPQPTHQAALRFLGHDFLAKTENLNLVGISDLTSLYPIDTKWSLHQIPLLGLTSNLVLLGTRSPACV